MTKPRPTGPLAVVLTLSAALVAAQTPVSPPPNHYTPQQDVQIGQQAAQQARQELPIMNDDLLASYVDGIGRRLVDAIPPDLRHPEFRYSFSVVNVSDINAFALPGGPMFVNRGMLDAAHDEGEVAGVMAHELSHVVLRHGTAQASQATKYQVGELAGAVLGAIVGGTWGKVISQGTQFGIGTYFLRFGREYEKQADIEGSHLMALAGYDPTDMASMFRTIEQQGGPGGPEWLSDHPNPGNRSEYITAEARQLTVQHPVHDAAEFARVRAHLAQLPPAPTTAQATSSRGNASAGAADAGTSLPRGSVQAPASSYRTYTEGGRFRISVPSNWKERPSEAAVTFAPEGAYGTADGKSVFTHGVEIGLARADTGDLRTATDRMIASLKQSNPGLTQSSGYEATTVDGRRAVRTRLVNPSGATGRPETIDLVTTAADGGRLLYIVGVAPRDAFGSYQAVFDRVIRSVGFLE